MASIEDKIKHAIDNELKGDLSTSNLHGVNLKECLVTPRLETFDDPRDQNIKTDLYVVLEEFPGAEDGYHIVFSPENGEFGLAIPGREKNWIFLGYYGTFLDTFKGM